MLKFTVEIDMETEVLAVEFNGETNTFAFGPQFPLLEAMQVATDHTHTRILMACCSERVEELKAAGWRQVNSAPVQQRLMNAISYRDLAANLARDMARAPEPGRNEPDPLCDELRVEGLGRPGCYRLRAIGWWADIETRVAFGKLEALYVGGNVTGVIDMDDFHAKAALRIGREF